MQHPHAQSAVGMAAHPDLFLCCSAWLRASEKPERYYSVGFCARTTKKHKNYDDGILVVCGRRCTLKDMSGKTVSTVLASFSTDRMEEG